ncbi:MAG: hypothetical protein H6R26_3596 [Proteobacteria bacterium]|nr:hypothetical protein [Pseudomonadota bacterium]
MFEREVLGSLPRLHAVFVEIGRQQNVSVRFHSFSVVRSDKNAHHGRLVSRVKLACPVPAKQALDMKIDWLQGFRSIRDATP